jgi:hypothetical protein
MSMMVRVRSGIPTSLPQRSPEATVATEPQRLNGSRNLMETAMTSNRASRSLVYAIATSLALGTAAAYAADDSRPDAGIAPVGSGEPVKVALAGTAAMLPMQGGAGEPMHARPQERGVRAAAVQGPTELRRYVQRTQGIYNYSYWDFAKYLPVDQQ